MDITDVFREVFRVNPRKGSTGNPFTMDEWMEMHGYEVERPVDHEKDEFQHHFL